tara:strand:+ start:132 stop:554 length:423 start_codon:yes stop_codon:yes gene_type:complete
MEQTNNVELYSKAVKSGSKMLKTNPFFKDFTSIMRNEEFKQFYNNYFKDWSDIQTMIFYMKLYTTIEQSYYSKYQSPISDELMTYTLHKIITTKEIRSVAIELFKGFKGEKLTILSPEKLENFNLLLDFDTTKKILMIEN